MSRVDTQGANGGSECTVNGTLAQQFAAFDSLPSWLREFLAEQDFNFDAPQAREYLLRCHSHPPHVILASLGAYCDSYVADQHERMLEDLQPAFTKFREGIESALKRFATSRRL